MVKFPFIPLIHSQLCTPPYDIVSTQKGREFVSRIKSEKIPQGHIQPVMHQFPALPVEELAVAHSARYFNGVLDGEVNNGFGNRNADIAQSCRYTTSAMVAGVVGALQRKVAVQCVPVSGFHHAGFDRASGFCTFNGLIIAANFAHRLGAKRVGILDFDTHFGDGTDDIMAELDIDYIDHVTATPVMTVPIKSKHTRAYHRDAVTFLGSMKAWLPTKVDVVLYQAGMDCHVDDDFGGGWMSGEQIRQRDETVFEFYKDANIPVIWNLAGGYGDMVDVVDRHMITWNACKSVYLGK